jgi:hypothetical protein
LSGFCANEDDATAATARVSRMDRIMAPQW